ncbi:MAG: hypothetical protein ACYDDH_11985, partial [Candidatus Desulforudaceae bacterium]
TPTTSPDPYIPMPIPQPGDPPLPLPSDPTKPGPVIPVPPGDWDDLNPPGGPPPSLNLDPLRRAFEAFTYKFPFSLPWDLMRGLNSLVAGGSVPEFNFSGVPLFGTTIFAFSLNMQQWEPVAAVVRVINIVLFNIGMIFATRRLLGGTV